MVLALLHYIADRNRVGMGNILRQYISPSQAEITFVDFKSESDPRSESIIAHSADKSASFEEEFSRDEELSIDQGDQS